MEIVHSMAGFTLGYADIVRRLLTRKNPAVVEREKEMFLAGADKNGIAKRDALAVFDMLASGAQYCYSRSAAVAEALFMYQTAWCRVHNQEAYVAACKEVF